MIAAYLLALVIGANPMTTAPEFIRGFASVEECVAAADQLNRGRGTSDSPPSIPNGTVHYCARVVYPA